MHYRKIKNDEVRLKKIVYTKNIKGYFTKGVINSIFFDTDDTIFVTIGFQRQSYNFSTNEVYIKIDDDREEKLNILVNGI